MSNAGIGTGKCIEFQNHRRFSSDSRRCSSNSAQYGYISSQPSHPCGVCIENGLGKSATPEVYRKSQAIWHSMAMARYVLVHGAFGGAWCWEPVEPGLEAAGHRVESFDLPGSGDDETPVADVTLDGYADRICGGLASDPEPAVLVGHSMGGMAVTHAAGRSPEHIAALVYV